MKSLKGKKIVVTGGASGIGYALCKLLAEKGAVVFSIDKGLPSVPLENVHYWSGDVTKDSDLKNIFSEIGKFDILVNNAGIIRRGKVFELKEPEFDLLFRVNVKGYWLVTRNGFPYLNKGGLVVFISSRHGINLPADPGVYAVTKQADIGIAEVFAKSYPQFDVKIICPGSVDTPLGRHQVGKAALEKKKKDMMTPEELAEKTLSLMLSGKKWLVFDEKKKRCVVR
jgi:NAD(P)-dependent dehydrogenase (short-subunit alcohol dehydrogenase family)